jgi:hypothetical protein
LRTLIDTCHSRQWIDRGPRLSGARQLRVPRAQQRGGHCTGNEQAGEERERDDVAVRDVALIAAYEGIVLLAATLRDPSLISAEGDRLNRRLDSLK